MPETVPYDEAVKSALDAVLVIDAAYGLALVEAGIHEDDVEDIQLRVRALIAEALNG